MPGQSNHCISHNVLHDRVINAVIVGDDRQVADKLQRSLQGCGCAVIGQFSGKAPVLAFAGAQAVDFAIVDLLSPGDDDGIETAVALRRQFAIPPVFLTGEVIGTKMDKLLQAEPLGYIARPINEAHVALVVDLARRLLCRPSPAPDELSAGFVPLGDGFEYNHELRSLYRQGEPIDLTPSERELFELCLQREGSVVPYETIIERVWHGKVVAESTRRGLYHRLRRKLGDRLFETVSSIGCRIRLAARRMDGH